jgi:hypothetical protein
MNEKRYLVRLNLTGKQIALLRNATSDLGVLNEGCADLQLRIANAILDLPENIRNDEGYKQFMGIH